MGILLAPFVFAGVIILYFTFIAIRGVISYNSSSTSESFTTQSNTDSNVYKKREIKYHPIRGANHQNLDINKHQGWFYGYAQCDEYNEFDIYAVAIFNHKDERLGFVRRNNYKLFNSLKQWDNGKALAWGLLKYDNYRESWIGGVDIAVGLSDEENEMIKEFCILKRENIDLNYKDNPNQTEAYFTLLNNNSRLKVLLKELDNEEVFWYRFPKKLVPTISKHLEKQKEWDKLIELEKHMDEIERLSETLEKATLRRIAKAKEQIGKS